ncbi:MAG: outer membrane beta-barrel protein [Deltaproteobacteria bacterium]|nr:outer membrane beta-barrel protein [Deltaproteobacteria bacterium]
MKLPAAPILLAAAALLLGGLATPATAWAVPPEDTTRIALQAGWRLQPNARFGEWAAKNGYPLSGTSPGGPALLAVFGYRPMSELEVSLEIGWAWERFQFVDAKPMQLNQLPITAAVRWAPLGGSTIYPYLGAGYGYLLNFLTDAPGGSVESHSSTPLLMAGAVFDITDRVSIVAEYRFAFSRIAIANLGFMQAGGNTFFVGAHLAFPPEDRRLK